MFLCYRDMRAPFQEVANRRPRAYGGVTLSVGLLLLVIAIVLAKTAPAGAGWTTTVTEELRGARAIGRGLAILCLVFYSATAVVTGFLYALLGQNIHRLISGADLRRSSIWRACLFGVFAVGWIVGCFWLMALILGVLGRWR
jgi:hypothetical protein